VKPRRRACFEITEEDILDVYNWKAYQSKPREMMDTTLLGSSQVRMGSTGGRRQSTTAIYVGSIRKCWPPQTEQRSSRSTSTNGGRSRTSISWRTLSPTTRLAPKSGDMLRIGGHHHRLFSTYLKSRNAPTDNIQPHPHAQLQSAHHGANSVW
jgi:hypothetical protein